MTNRSVPTSKNTEFIKLKLTFPRLQRLPFSLSNRQISSFPHTHTHTFRLSLRTASKKAIWGLFNLLKNNIRWPTNLQYSLQGDVLTWNVFLPLPRPINCLSFIHLSARGRRCFRNSRTIMVANPFLWTVLQPITNAHFHFHSRNPADWNTLMECTDTLTVNGFLLEPKHEHIWIINFTIYSVDFRWLSTPER